MDKKPRFFDLMDYVKDHLNKLSSWHLNPELKAFCQLNHIVNSVVNLCTRYDQQLCADITTFELALKLDRSVVELLPLEGTALHWLENYFGATFSNFRTDPYDDGGGYIYYTLREPNFDRVQEMDPKFPDRRWTGGEWVWL